MNLYQIDGDKIALNLHPGQQQAWESVKRFVFIISGSQGGKTSFGPWWLWREIKERGGGDYLAVTSSYDLFKLKMLPEITQVFQHILKIGRLWAGDKILELKNPQTGQFEANQSTDPMWGRIILRSAAAKGGLESATAKAAWLDEVGQDEFTLGAWEAVIRRLSLSQGRVLGTTTPYNLGWLKQQIYDKWQRGASDIDVIQFASTLNPAFPKEEYERAQSTMPGWKFRMFYAGQFERPAGMIYEDFIDRYHEHGGHKITPFTIPQEWPRFVGIDPGAVHTAKVWLAQDPESTIYYLYRSSLEGGLSTGQHADAAIRLARENNENVVLWTVGAKSEEQQRMDYREAGLMANEPPVHDVESGIDRVTTLLKQHRLLVFDNQYGVLDEIATYRRELDDSGQPTEKIKDKETYHHLDALRYAVVGVTTLTEPAGSIIYGNQESYEYGSSDY